MRRLRTRHLAFSLLFLVSVSTSLACDLTVLGASDSALVKRSYRSRIVAPQEHQRKLLGETAQYMTPLLCAGVRDVVFVEADSDMDDAAVMGWVYSNHSQSTLYINSLPNRAAEVDLAPSSINRIVGNVWATGIETLLHEGAHAAVNLLNTQVMEGDCTLWYFFCDEPTDASQWASASVTLAAAAMKRMRIRVSFEAEWNRLHQSFVNVGLARPYGPKLPAGDVASAGFMTAYGGTKPSEDIAEFVAQVQASNISSFKAISATVNRGERPDLGCIALSEVYSGVPGNLAALYTKISLLRDVGLISSEAAAACTGNAAIDTRDAPGIHFFSHEGEFQRTFNTEVSATMGSNTSGDRFKFRLSAKGTAMVGGVEHPAEFSLILDLGPTSETIERVSWPRGIYQLALLGENRLIVTVPSAGHATYHVDDGMVLITSASAERIEGSIVMNRATRPHAPGMVPMAAADLSRVTFRIDGSR